MKRCFAYTRVSTAKQGEKGVSLQEQRDAILRYAERQGLEIVESFEERETAAKRGRPRFGKMLKLLRQGKADGVIIHKIDRSARNLRDWADLGELIDQGIDVHFANESLDLHTRGGRLSADIQAVVAADYIRNLREEARKGFYGRLKQGLYPLPAPLGYRDEGAGKPKSVDPVAGPLVRRVFGLYATGEYSLDALVDEAFRLRLRNRRGGRVTRTGLSTVLNNPFYVGLIRIRRTGETFPGVHEALVSTSLFERVQGVLHGKAPKKVRRHAFLFRRLLRCARCGYSLIGERQKGHVYYRCHSKSCPTKGVREEAVEEAVRTSLAPLQLTAQEKAHLAGAVAEFAASWQDEREKMTRTIRLQVDQLAARLERLTDAFVDGLLEKEPYEERRKTLLLERTRLEETLASLKDESQDIPEQLSRFLELAGSACLLYEKAEPHEKRELLRIVTSNRVADGKKLVFTLSEPFQTIANRPRDSHSAPYRATTRTYETLLRELVRWLKHSPEAFDKFRIRRAA